MAETDSHLARMARVPESWIFDGSLRAGMLNLVESDAFSNLEVTRAKVSIDGLPPIPVEISGQLVSNNQIAGKC